MGGRFLFIAVRVQSQKSPTSYFRKAPSLDHITPRKHLVRYSGNLPAPQDEVIILKRTRDEKRSQPSAVRSEHSLQSPAAHSSASAVAMYNRLQQIAESACSLSLCLCTPARPERRVTGRQVTRVAGDGGYTWIAGRSSRVVR